MKGDSIKKRQNIALRYIFSKTNELAQKMGLGSVELYLEPDSTSTASAFRGLNSKIIYFAPELIESASTEMIDAVIAHELAHIKYHHALKNQIFKLSVRLLYAFILIKFQWRYSLRAVMLISCLAYFVNNWMNRQIERTADWEGMIHCNSNVGAILFCLEVLEKNYELKHTRDSISITPEGNFRGDVEYDSCTDRLALALSFKANS